MACSRLLSWNIRATTVFCPQQGYVSAMHMEHIMVNSYVKKR